jgi:hypothetical protein
MAHVAFFFRFKQFFPDSLNLQLHRWESLRWPVLCLLLHTVEVNKRDIFRNVVLYLHPVYMPTQFQLIILYMVTYSCVLQLDTYVVILYDFSPLKSS